jgi:hypothetical protein
LTTWGDGATLEVSSTAATRSFLRIARCKANESAASGHDSFLLDHSLPWSSRSRRTRLANYDSAEDATVDVSSVVSLVRPTATAIRLSAVMRSEPHSVPPNFSERVCERRSTLDRGRRIMAERRRTPRGRRGQTGRPPRLATNDSIDHRLRALVRTLARQAARETFEAQVKAHSQTIQ